MTYYRIRPTRDDYDRLVNDKWRGIPLKGRVPQSEQETIDGFRLLYRKACGRKFVGRIKITSGNRRTWRRHGVWSVNPDENRWTGSRGWQEIIHSLAHWFEGNHTQAELRLERDLTDFALKRGFHEGRLESAGTRLQKSEKELIEILTRTKK